MNHTESADGGKQRTQVARVKRVVDGILLLDKSAGITSNRALQQVKRLYGAAKAGHTGSLDPLATGMLPICFGHATKASHWMLDADKVYEVRAAIGIRTATGDADGEPVEQSPVQLITREQLDEGVASHRGQILQVPPMYSALKKDGVRLYELARDGQEVERQARLVTIYALEVVHFDPQQPVLRVRCSKGTYIRTLIEDIAAAMGTLAHIVALRRLSAGSFAEADMLTLDRIMRFADDHAALDQLLLPVDAGLDRLPAISLQADETYYFRRGQSVGHASAEIDGLVRVYDDQSVFVGVGEVLSDGRITPRRLFT